jgi:hypothetical protein
VTVQETPSESISFATVALTGACAVAVMVVGSVCVHERDGDSATIVVNADTEFAGVVDDAAEEVAVMITCPPVGIAAGAV